MFWNYSFVILDADFFFVVLIHFYFIQSIMFMLRSQIGQFLCESFASDDYHSSYAEPINNPAYTATCFSICQQHVPGN